jgi:hypothetical protein
MQALGNELSPEQNPIVMGAIQAIMGQHPDPEGAITAFIQVYGQEAFAQLREGVLNESTSEERGNAGLGSLADPQEMGGMITGPGTGTSDSIPGQITQNGQPVEDIKVADGEYILPKATVDAVGEPALDQLRQQTAGAR